jgi:hypothetical protein
MNKPLVSVLGVVLTLVLVVVLGGLAVRQVITQWDGSENRFQRSSVVAEPERGPTGNDDIALVGDSITENSIDALRHTLEGPYRMRVRSRGGYRVEEMEPYAIEVATTQPEQAVVNLGTNDVLKATAYNTAMAALDRLITTFRSARCVYLVTVNESFRTADDPGIADRARLFNTGVRNLARQRHVRVIDWAQTIEDSLAKSTFPPLTSETVHPSEAGQQALADLYKKNLDNCG